MMKIIYIALLSLALLCTSPVAKVEAQQDHYVNRFAVGYCTYWASSRYTQLHRYQYPPWLGNAYQWVSGAARSHWHVSRIPRKGSIIVLQPYVQGASWLGHVAIVEAILRNGRVLTSNMSWWANGGGWNRVSFWIFHIGPGVSFIWK